MSEIETLREELFCTKYELDAFADFIINGKAERWLPSFTDNVKEIDHLNRYLLTYEFVHDKKVLDIACGAGKGSYLMGTKGNAHSVLGADISSLSIRYASHRYCAPNVSFAEIDGTRLAFNEEFDVVVSFETIEHIATFKEFLKNAWKALKPNGTFIVSTPVSGEAFDAKPLNPFHTQEWGFDEFQRELNSENFVIEKTFIQLDHKLKSPSLYKRVFKRAFYKKENIIHYTGYNEKRVEEYVGQYDKREFGKIRNGFQIVICKKN